MGGRCEGQESSNHTKTDEPVQIQERIKAILFGDGSDRTLRSSRHS